MSEWWGEVAAAFQGDLLPGMVRAVFVLALGWMLAKVASLAVVRLGRKYTSAQGAMVARRVSFYLILVIAVASALGELGFDLGVLLGTAGILTVAIGFASQTSASNLVSGLFLIGERAFVVGDMIRIGSTTGEVLSIDLLSVKLRTFDNLYVRVPNETLIKSEITNFTRFPIRRMDLTVRVAYKEDLNRVREVLMAVAERNPLCLDEPAPLFIVNGFGESSLDLQFSVWALRQNFLTLRNSIQIEIKAAFDANGIEIPFPQRTLHLVPSEPAPEQPVAQPDTQQT